MEIKVGCDCGQNYTFDVEPVNGRMPATIACPSCGADGTESANHFLAQQLPPPAPSVPGALRINRPAPSPTVSVPPPISATPGPITPRSSPAVKAASKPKKAGEFNFAMGIVGAIVGAVLGAGLIYGFFAWTHVRFPFMGTIIGALTGWVARTLAKGTESGMGAIAAFIALAATFGVLYFMYGGMAGVFIITLAVSAYFAYRIAA